MKFVQKHYKFIILLLVIFLIYIIFITTNSNNLNYTALGDAYALGVDSYERIDYGYSDYLKDYLSKNQKLNFYTKSYCEKDMSIERLTYAIITNKKMTYKNKKMNLKEILRESDVLTLTIGLNDLFYKISITSNLTTEKINSLLTEIDTSLTSLLDEMQKYYPKKIIFIGYYESPAYNKYINYSIKKLNSIISKKPQITFISTESLFKQNKNLTSNPKLPYPNTKGYKEIAKLIEQEITL